MESLSANDITLSNGEKTRYYEGGSRDGVPLIFVHGFPDLAEIWKHQLLHFSTVSKFRVIALDMRGYGLSSAPSNRRSYSMEALSSELVDFAHQLNIKKAVWVGHDWGSGVVNALAAHYPELFIGLALVAIPYRTLELGLNHLATLSNRDLYPKDEAKWGLWEYMRFMELYPEKAVKELDDHGDVLLKLFHIKSDPSSWGQPSFLATVLKDGGWFGGHPENAPDLPLEATILDESLLESLKKSHKAHGFFGAIAYYLNHDVNEEYAKKEKNGGVLDFPVLFIDAKYDPCSPSVMPKMGEAQKGFIKNLTLETVEAGHWAQLEKPKEVNEALEKWLDTLKLS